MCSDSTSSRRSPAGSAIVLRSAGGRRVRHNGSGMACSMDGGCGGRTNGSILARFWLPLPASLRAPASADNARAAGPALLAAAHAVTSQGASESVSPWLVPAAGAPPGRSAPARNRRCARRAAAGRFRRLEMPSACRVSAARRRLASRVSGKAVLTPARSRASQLVRSRARATMVTCGACERIIAAARTATAWSSIVSTTRSTRCSAPVASSSGSPISP
jgi:hypothetical protein